MAAIYNLQGTPDIAALCHIVTHTQPLSQEIIMTLFSLQDEEEIPMINIPGQRFTATHGIKAKKGEAKLFL